MAIIVLVLILVGALLAVITGLRALDAYLRFRRARAEFEGEVTEEVARLAARTDELEVNISALDARASELPIQISELQQSLSTLQVLASALGASLRQVQKVLTFNALKTLSGDRAGRMLRNASVPKNTGSG